MRATFHRNGIYFSTRVLVGTVIIGDPVVGTVNPPDLPTASSLMSQPPYRTQKVEVISHIFT